MPKTSKPSPPADLARRQAVIYARVSSKEQEKEGFSIPAQLKLLREYAATQQFPVAQEYVDVETAKQTGRSAFGDMVAYLKAHPSIRVMLVEKTDRLYRNLKDWVTVDELEVEIHFPKEGVVLSRESRSSEKFMHGIKVLMAKNYIDNLSEEARKGMQEKAEQGIWPTKSPLGYRDAGFIYRRTGASVPISAVHSILRNRLYTGQFEWNGKLIQGQHQPLVSFELWERVQSVLDGRNASKAKRGKHDFAFAGLIACVKCGCSVVGEVKKQRYVYYHCTGYADKCQGNPTDCRRKYVREQVLEQRFTELLGRLQFDSEVLEWVRESLRASHTDERREHEEAIRRLQAEHKRLGDRINAMYLDKLDGRIDGAFFDKMSAQWRADQARCGREIALHESAEQSYMDEGIQILELARDAQKLFERQQPREKRRLLNFVLSNCSWKDGEVVATFRQPFDLLAQTTTTAMRNEMGLDSKSTKSEIWLGN
jgi:site-specific DNA recombinase